jgi:hypothetical protein
MSRCCCLSQTYTPCSVCCGPTLAVLLIETQQRPFYFTAPPTPPPPPPLPSFLTSSSNPRSTMRSASSRHRYLGWMAAQHTPHTNVSSSGSRGVGHTRAQKAAPTRRTSRPPAVLPAAFLVWQALPRGTTLLLCSHHLAAGAAEAPPVHALSLTSTPPASTEAPHPFSPSPPLTCRCPASCASCAAGP